jgi:hypothetical protein
MEGAERWIKKQPKYKRNPRTPEHLWNQPKYVVDHEDLNNDWESEVVVRRTKDSTLYSVNGYSLVKGKHQERHGYDTLFPNEFARKAAHAQGIKQKNYLKRMAQYEATNLQLQPGQYNPIGKGRHERLTKGQLAKIGQHKFTLLQALRYLCLDLCYKAFTRAVAHSIGEPWKISGRYLLSLYSKAAPQFLKNLVYNLGGLTYEQFALFGSDQGQMSLGQFVKGNPQLIDSVWIRFVAELWDGNPKQEKQHYTDFVRAVWNNYEQIRNDAVKRLNDRWEEIQAMNDAMRFDPEEVSLAKAKFDREIAAFNVIDQFFQNKTENPRKIALLGLEIPLFPPSDVSLLTAMELRMDAQLLNIKGIREGKITGKPMPTPPGVSRKDITASQVAAAKTRGGMHPADPIPPPVIGAPVDQGAAPVQTDDDAELNAIADAVLDENEPVVPEVDG